MANFYTTEEIDIIKNFIGKTPNNIKYALEQSAQYLNRSFTSVNSLYYNKIRKTVPVLGLVSPHGGIVNIKNTPRITEDTVVFSIAKLAVQKLNKKERIELVNCILQMQD